MTGFALFMLEATTSNIIFVKQLMKIICTLNDNKLTTREELRLNTGVERVMVLPCDVHCFGVTALINHISEPDNREARENGVKI